MHTYQRTRILLHGMAVISFLVPSPDGTLFASGGTESTVMLWPLPVSCADRGSCTTPVMSRVLDAGRGMVCAAAFSPGSRRLATADDGSVRVRDAQGGDRM